MQRTRVTAATIATLALLVAACGGGDDDGGASPSSASPSSSSASDGGDTANSTETTAAPADGSPATTAAADGGATATDATTGETTGSTTDGATGGAAGGATDLASIGLWDDGPCDPSLPPLVVGNISPHESPVLSLLDHVVALQAAAEAFNARGGANGSCIVVVACDDGNNFDQALGCAREIVDGDVVATLNDSDTIASAEISAALADARIPRIGGNVSPSDWGGSNEYPIGTSTAVTFLLPDALIQQGITEIGVVRVDLPAAAAAQSMFESTYSDNGATVPADVAVPAGTTDYTQFVLAAEDAGATGIMLALGSQEAIQVARAAQQLGTDLAISASLGSFSYNDVVDIGDFASQMAFVWPFAPVTIDLPVYEVMRADLAASGEASLEPENMKSGAMLSWISLYGLLEIIRDAGLTDFTRESISTAVDAAQDVPMLGIFGDETWTPALDYEGLWKRVGIDRYTYWTWDPDASWNGEPGNFVLGGEISFSEALCGSAFGAPGPC
jgi:ABC-type branched-subunit amino acid transport system substrate-binding protein